MPRLYRIIATFAAATAALLSVALATADGPSVATLTATLVDSTGAAIGNVQLNQDAAGTVTIVLDASKLPAGPHGIHFHATGKCEGPGFTTASGHFNPGGKTHGLASAGGPHAGDLDQIDTASVSQGYYTSTTTRVSLTGGATSIHDVDGTALVVHAAADDQVTDPTGNSGARIACAVLAVANPALAKPPVAPGPPNTGTGVTGDSGSNTALVAGIALAALAVGGAGLRLGRGLTWSRLSGPVAR